MKRHFRPFLADNGFLSLEEEAMLMTEIADCENNSDNAIATADRVLEVQRGMDDVGIILATMPDPTSVEEQLARAVADMAVAGTDIDPTILLPDVSDPLEMVATEDNGAMILHPNHPQSSERVKDPSLIQKMINALAEVWEAIKQALAEAWKSVKQHYNSVFGAVEAAQRNVKELLAKYTELGSVEPTDHRPIVIFDSGDTFRVGGKMLLGEDRFKAVERLNSFAMSLYGIAPKKVLNIGKHIENAFRSFDPNRLDDFTKRFSHDMGELFEDYAKTFTSDYLPDAHNGQGNVTLTSAPLLGNFQATITVPGPLANKEVEDPMEIITYVSKVRASISKMDTNVKDNHAGLSIPIQNSDVYRYSLMGVAKIINIMLDYKSGSVANQLAMQSTAIEKATSMAIDHAKRSTDPEAFAVVKRVLPINSAYANWASQPMMKVLGQLIRVVNADIRVARLALHHFK